MQIKLGSKLDPMESYALLPLTVTNRYAFTKSKSEKIEKFSEHHHKPHHTVYLYNLKTDR
jgi:hypothetical protein